MQSQFQAGVAVNEQITLVSMNLYPTRDYRDQWRRQYTLQMTGQTENALYDLVSRYGPDRAFSNQGISQVNGIGFGSDAAGAPPSLATGGLIRYSATPTAQVGIANGWGTQRMRFELLVMISKNNTPSYYEKIIGYTDYYGSSNLNGRAVQDPNMIYTIDSITREPIEMISGLGGMAAQTQIGGSSIIVTNQSPIANPFAANAGQHQYVMRPQDVFIVADSQEVINGASDSGMFMTQSGLANVGHQQTYIADTMLNHMAKPSNRRNDLINSYGSRLFTNMYQAQAIQLSPAADEFLSPQSQAMMKVQEMTVQGYSFPFSITRLAGGTCSTTGQFTQAELLRLDPGIDDRTTVFAVAEDSAIMVPPTSMTEQTSAVSNHSIIGAMTYSTVLALMSTHGFTTISCKIDNFGGSPRCVVNGGVGPSQQNLSNLTASFESSVVIELGTLINSSGVGSFVVDVYAELHNLVYIKMRLNGEIQETPFVYPSWASSANTPIVSSSFEHLSGLASTVNEIVGGVTKKSNPMVGQVQQPFTTTTPAAMPQILGPTGVPVSGPSQIQMAPPATGGVQW